ncbi:hypothetical protein ACLOJK_028123 [Asimina triloba]
MEYLLSVHRKLYTLLEYRDYLRGALPSSPKGGKTPPAARSGRGRRRRTGRQWWLCGGPSDGRRELAVDCLLQAPPRWVFFRSEKLKKPTDVDGRPDLARTGRQAIWQIATQPTRMDERAAGADAGSMACEQAADGQSDVRGWVVEQTKADRRTPADLARTDGRNPWAKKNRGGRAMGRDVGRTLLLVSYADGFLKKTQQEAGWTDAATNRRRWQASDGWNRAYLDSGGASRWTLMLRDATGGKRRAYLDLGRRFAALGFAGSQDDYG